MTDTSWFAFAACKGADTAAFFDQFTPIDAMQLCFRCPVRAECLAYAVDNKIDDGVYGGLTATQRRRGCQQMFPIVPAAGSPGLRNQALELHRQGLTWRQVSQSTGMPYRQVARFLSRYPRELTS